MSERIQRYRRKKARGELLGDLGHLLLNFGLGGALVIAFAAGSLPAIRAWFLLLAGGAMAGMGWGLYRGIAWLRWPAAALLSWGLGLLALRVSREGFGLDDVLPLLFCVFYIPYLVAPSTRELFERAHAPIAAETEAES